MIYCDKEYIAKVIKNARRQKGLKQSELAEKIGLSEKHLSKIETGKNYPSLDNFFKILQILEMPLSSFIKSEKAISANRSELDKILNTSSESQISVYLNLLKVLQGNLK